MVVIAGWLLAVIAGWLVAVITGTPLSAKVFILERGKFWHEAG